MSGMRCSSEIALNCTLPGSTEDGLGHRPDHVDVEALDLAAERVEEAEVVGALVHPGDEVAAGADLRHERARRHLRRAGRAQAARRRIAGVRGGRAHRLGPGGRPDGGRVTRLGRGRRGPQRQPGRGDHHQDRPPPGHAGTRPRVHRYSASRRLRPQAQPPTITSDATIMPTASPVNASRPLRALAAKTAWWVVDPLAEGRGQPRETGGGVAAQRGLHGGAVIPGVVLGAQRRVRLVPGPGLRRDVGPRTPAPAAACTAASSVPGPGPRSFCWAR